ncbi:MAG: hypothetical protein OQK12_09265, partial [Motiliproteus sp.]|nr:hypothetical protein [Motiliproteus sp.]
LQTVDQELQTLSWSFTAIRDEKGGLVAILSLIEDVTEELRQQKELQFRATTDLLTGLPNRYKVAEQL